MPDDTPIALTPEFVQRLTAGQSALYAFVVSLMGGVDQANDVLQETNLKLCKRAGEYDAAQPFLRWAYAFARFEVMAWRKRQTRSRLVLDDELVALVAADFDETTQRAEHQLAALETCVEKLPLNQRELVTARYRNGLQVREIAAQTGRPENTVAALLYRVRKALAACVENALPKEDPA
jgi:RNA polymerase sigma-70 factor (ECF subfamily)